MSAKPVMTFKTWTYYGDLGGLKVFGVSLGFVGINGDYLCDQPVWSLDISEKIAKNEDEAIAIARPLLLSAVDSQINRG